MISLDGFVLAQSRVVYQWLRVEQLSQWWHWLLLAVVVLAVLGHAVVWYRRDWIDQARQIGLAMLILRLVALVGVLVYFFQLDKRTEQRIVRDSRVVVLADTSLSMITTGTPSASGVPNSKTRSEEVVELIAGSPVLQQLSEKHSVAVYRFDQGSRPVAIASLPKNAAKSPSAEGANNPDDSDSDTLSRLQLFAKAGVVLVSIALFFILVPLLAQLVRSTAWHFGSWMLLIGACVFILALVFVAWVVVPNTQYPLAQLFGWTTELNNSAEQDKAKAANEVKPEVPTDWAAALAPTGAESRLGDALRSVLDRELGNPLAGIVIVTDGRSNAGVDPKAVLPIAQNARVPFYVIGVGSEKRPPNLQMVEVDAPRRLYPGDRFSISALIASSGFEGRTISIQFLSGSKDSELQAMQLETETTVEIPADGSLISAKVELPPKAVGSWSYAARIVAASGEADERDNVMRTDVEVIQRQNRVLVFAGGPLREYQFVRNLLYRDQDVESHVFLQSGGPLTSQESKKLLDEFPADRTALAQYDAILSFDADWTKVPEASVQAVEKWVSEQAGGLLVVAGSVETPKWLARSASGVRSQLLRDLSPVVLDVRGSALLAAGRVESESIWPLTITPEGKQTEFFWLTDEPQTSMELWQNFQGVHTYYSAFELKPGAKALALFSDPTAAASGQQPIYIASQFYGAGRVVFHGGSELWRLRGLGDQYFDRYYTKLVRWISQGRLLLDSDRGVLLVDREEAVQGEQVSVRAVLKNERYEPLVQSEVVARLVDPQGLNVPVVLRPLMDGSQPGVYSGQFPVLTPGTYRLTLQLGGLASEEVLKTQVQVRVPKLEMQVVERHDALLSQLATETGGKYWKGVNAAIHTENGQGQCPIVEAIMPQDQVAYSPGAPEREFQLRWLGWLMTLISSCLTLEWLTRRIHRLA
jgi:von Willebrand factor type A domain